VRDALRAMAVEAAGVAAARDGRGEVRVACCACSQQRSKDEGMCAGRPNNSCPLFSNPSKP